MPTQDHSERKLYPGLQPKGVIRIGKQKGIAQGDAYHFLLRITWPQFFALIVLFYLLVSSLFALAYLVERGSIANARPGSFQDAFFYSVDILSTVGYSDLHPHTLYAKLVGVGQAIIGLLSVAVVTGLTFARFSKPKAHILFSRVAVVAPFNGVPTLMIRVANQRSNLILEAQARVGLVQNEITQEGQFIRRLHDLPLARHQSPMFNLSWTIMHPIDEHSPFHKMSIETLREKATELAVILTGTDEVMDQVIHTRHSYFMDDIKWDMDFVDILSWSADGQITVDYSKFHQIVPVSSGR